MLSRHLPFACTANFSLAGLCRAKADFIVSDQESRPQFSGNPENWFSDSAFKQRYFSACSR